MTYFKEMYKSDIENMFGLDLSKISNNEKTEKRFDFVFTKGKHVYPANVTLMVVAALN